MLLFALSLALAQPPAEAPPPPETVCLTNACAPAAKPIAGAGSFRSVREAIAGGSAFSVRDLGGTPMQAMEALFERLKSRPAATAEERLRMGGYDTPFHRFADVSDGSTLSFGPPMPNVAGPDGTPAVGGIARTYPDGRVEIISLFSNGGGMAMLEPPKQR